ncbi:hypothetical protein, partial [Anaplasma marginale]|uniref:hypothetical protein n=1 Tax=Anaplasma marginale TaxID=770 RepID=UPI0005B49061
MQKKIDYGKRAYYMAKYIKESLLNVEEKYHDTSDGFTLGVTGYNGYNLTAIDQGTDDTERVGDSIKAKSIDLQILMRNADQNGSHFVKVI